MSIFLGKFSSHFPKQIEDAYYQTDRVEMFDKLAENDYVFAIGNGIIQLWKAIGWQEVEDGKRMNFEKIQTNLNINTNEFIALKCFKLSKSLIIYSMRQGSKAFYPIELKDGFDFEQLKSIEYYLNESNYRKISLFESKNQIDKTESEDLWLYKSGGVWKIIAPFFANNDVFRNFNDNTSKIGKGRRQKDSTLRKILGATLPYNFVSKDLSIRSLYDAFCCDYKEKEIEIETDEIIDIDENELKNNRMDNLKPLNQILYGPPGTGKTFNSINHAISIIEEKAIEEICSEDRNEIIRRFNIYKEKGIVTFITFHQSFGYEDFIEGIKPKLSDETSDYSGELEYELIDGVFKEMCANAESYNEYDSTRKQPHTISSDTFKGKRFFKVSLGNTQGDSGDLVYNYCRDNNYISIGWGGEDVDYTGVVSKKDIITKYKEAGYNPKNNDFNISAIERLALWMRKGDIVFASHGNKMLKAVGIIEGDYEFKGNDSNSLLGYNHYRKVKWLINDVKIPVSKVYKKNFSQQSIYELYTDKVIQEYFTAEEPLKDKNIKNHVLIIDEINRGNVSAIFGELITLIEEDKRQGGRNSLSLTLPYSKKSFSVPSNLYLLGTMNTADRSVESLDTALRRRFSFVEMLPQAHLLSPSAIFCRFLWKYEDKDWEDLEYKEIEDLFRSFLKIDDETIWESRITIWNDQMKGKDQSNLSHFDHFPFKGINLQKVLQTINDRIEVLIDRDHTIGHAYFMDVIDEEGLKLAFKNKIIPLLQEYFYGDYQKIEMVIGSNFFNQAKKEKVTFAIKNDNYEDQPVRYELVEIGSDFDIYGAIDKLLNEDKKGIPATENDALVEQQ